MRKQYKKSRFKKVWFRRINMAMEYSWVPLECFDHSKIRRMPHRKRHDLRPWE